jgi:hypothetical protein
MILVFYPHYTHTELTLTYSMLVNMLNNKVFIFIYI